MAMAWLLPHQRAYSCSKALVSCPVQVFTLPDTSTREAASICSVSKWGQGARVTGEETGIRVRSGSGQNTGRDTNGGDPIREIAHHSSAGTDGDIRADAHLLNHRSADTNPAPGTYLHLTS